MTPKSFTESGLHIGSLPSEPKQIHQSKSNEDQLVAVSPSSKPANEPQDDQTEPEGLPSKPRRSTAGEAEAVAEASSRERLKRHRVEVAGQVWIPDIWGQEELLKDWIDCTTFDASLVRSNIMSARAALVEDRRRIRANSRGLRIENRC